MIPETASTAVLNGEVPSGPHVDLLSMDELYESLKGKIPKTTLYFMAREHLIPSYRVGRKGFRFILAEVLSSIHRPAM